MFLNKYGPIYSAGKETILGTVFKVYMCTCFFIITIIGIVRAIQGTAALKQEYDNNLIFILRKIHVNMIKCA